MVVVEIGVGGGLRRKAPPSALSPGLTAAAQGTHTKVPQVSSSLSPAQEALSNFLYVPFLCICVCGAVYTGFFLPETKGKTFLEISQELHRLNFPGQAQGPTWIGPHIVQSTEL